MIDCSAQHVEDFSAKRGNTPLHFLCKNGKITAAEVESLAQQAAADMQKRAEKEQHSFDDFMAHLRKEFRLPEARDATPAPA